MSLVERFEGRSHALTMLEPVLCMPKDKFVANGGPEVLDNLAANTQGKPADYAAGINDVIKQVRKLIGEGKA